MHAPHYPKDLEFHCFVVTVAQASLELHVLHHTLLVSENKIRHSSSRCWLICHLEMEGINVFQEPAGLPVSCCVILPTDTGVFEVAYEDQGL